MIKYKKEKSIMHCSTLNQKQYVNYSRADLPLHLMESLIRNNWILNDVIFSYTAKSYMQ